MTPWVVVIFIAVTAAIGIDIFRCRKSGHHIDLGSIADVFFFGLIVFAAFFVVGLEYILSLMFCVFGYILLCPMLGTTYAAIISGILVLALWYWITANRRA